MKPFKVGATYKLKKEYVNEFNWSFDSSLGFPKKVPFTFTVSRIDLCGDIYCGYHIITYKRERHMFKRIDNK